MYILKKLLFVINIFYLSNLQDTGNIDITKQINHTSIHFMIHDET